MVDNVPVVDRGAPASRTAFNVSRPRVTNSNIYTTDITEKFFNAARKLPAGTLIKDEQFTLFESVGALEIGDPKMDSGCHDPSDDPDSEFDVTKPLLPSEVLWVMDELLSREVAWHTGYPLSQTLFTSYHIDSILWPNPFTLAEARFGRGPSNHADDPLLHRFLRSYCLGLIKCCDYVLSMVTSQHYYEEEDFATQLFNREMLSRFSGQEVASAMHEGLQWLHTADLDYHIKQQLQVRLQFRITILDALSQHAVNLLQVQEIDRDLIAKMRSSKVGGSPVVEAFSPKIQRRLASSVPPRPMITTNLEAAYDYWENTCQHMKDIYNVLAASQSHDLVLSLSLLNLKDPQPSLYVRALLQAFLTQFDRVLGHYNTIDFIMDDIQVLTLPSSPMALFCGLDRSASTKTERTAQQSIHEFISKIERSYLNVLRTFCLNRCRLRRTLCHAALEWDQIQAEAEDQDDYLSKVVGEQSIAYPVGAHATYSYPLSSWVYHYKLNQIQLIIQVGFELSIYAPTEMAGMYWYLAHTCDTHLAHLERISFFVSQREASLRGQSKPSTAAATTTATTAALNQCHDTIQFLYRHFTILKATESLARALHNLYTVLDRHHQLKRSNHPTYSTDSLRHEIRMKPFQYLSVPEPLSFDQFATLSNLSSQPDETLLNRATTHLAIARKGWEEALKMNWNAFQLRKIPNLDNDSRRPGATTTTTAVHQQQSDNETESGTQDVISKLFTQDVKSTIKSAIATGLVVVNLKRHLDSPLSVSSASTATSPERQQQHQQVQDQPTMRTTIPQAVDKDNWHKFWIVPRVEITKKEEG